jgi:DNA-binding response OmpR family regulator
MQEARLRVLIADDEEVIANMLAIILNQAGFDAHAVYSGEKAVEWAKRFKPDMLISDVVMTGITGIEAATQVRAVLPRCRILLFSGQAANVDLLAEADAQSEEFEIVAKPIHPADLLARLRGDDAPEGGPTGETKAVASWTSETSEQDAEDVPV